MTDTAPPESLRTVSQLLERKAAAYGDRTFFKCSQKELSFADIEQKTAKIANRLHEIGISSGDHVCLYLYNSAEYLLMYLAAMRLGAIVVPIDTRFTGDMLLNILNRVKGDAIFLDKHTHSEYEKIRGQQSAAPYEYYIGTPPQKTPYRSFDEFRGNDQRFSKGSPISSTDPGSVTFIQQQQTSQPKGVVLPQFSYINTGWESGQNLFNFTEDDCILTSLPLYSIFTFQLGIMGALITGSTFVLLKQFDPHQFWSKIREHDASVFLYLSRMLSVLYNQQDLEQYEENTVNFAIGHGFGFRNDENLIKNFEQRFDITVLEGYGTTQVGTIATYNRPDQRRIGSVGQVASFADVDIVDENDWSLPENETGEIVVRPTRNNTMMLGYHDNHGQAVRDCRNQWIHTGDIGYKDEDGYLFFVANKENSIYRGQIAGRISTLEIESVINSHGPVRECAVTGVSMQDDTEAVVAVVVPQENKEVTPPEIYRYCKQRLPYIKIPRYIDVRKELPRTPTGKIRTEVLNEISIKEAWDRDQGYEFSR